MTSTQMRVDVSAALPFAAERNTIAAELHLPETAPRAILVCWPGGSYDRSYWDARIEGHAGYSFADHMTARGFAVVATDHLGVGESSRPADVDAVALESMAAACAAFTSELRHRLAAGTLSERLAPGLSLPVIGVGHSLGGCICVFAQAAHDCYDAIANLGFTHGSKDALEDGPTASVADPAGPRAAGVAQAKAFFGDDWDAGYAVAAREPSHPWLYAPDVPAAVIAADDRTVAAWPRQSYADALTAGFTAPFAARVKVPVFLGFGDRDIPEHPRDDAGFYTSSNDITVFVLEGSAHCHNFAGKRAELWNRLASWAAAVQ
ncbi:alpha/beta fold hydrolase [Solirubrobacter soli]|uniref:alpha/beta fold hydrolase n=1 Tax=Solirubrobacter soli TaxID=363832 RepID=UPI000487789C|nr:alpha/beta hydrolase [Solirubrobacter soli]